ncbi:OPT family oligopeptide transporter [Sandaracinus amylolyticus]|uniref:Oligopeptide transporter, OPT family n=1 Tax=Sandaracinus amylolyticus TaxID=927083 RepID=A0A0F6YN51_9BACT|nr:OPT family oligopeptide transporter [Sandaracinus amylolyticus]AKF10885.1 Oligopeptide transporter, OPT family [Sandaracinus amylolyticus]
MTNAKAAEAELTWRAVLTGAVLGGVLSLCNIYSGLRIGWGFNMSITAALLGWGFWRVVGGATRAPAFTKLENNLNQTGASAGASISSAGLVSAIPAMTMLTGRELSYPELACWLFVIGMVGVTVGIALRRQMIEVDKLPFANGIASAETLDKMYAAGADAARKVRALVGAGALAALTKTVLHFAHVASVAVPGSLAVGARRASMMNLTVAIDPSPLMIAVGALGSVRTGITMLCGGLFSWLVLGPWVIANGWAQAGADDPTQSWFGPMVRWLLWPGVSMMVTSSLTTVALSWRSIVRTFTGGSVDASEDGATRVMVDEVPRRAYLALVAVVAVLAVIGQIVLFDIAWWAALAGVMLSFVLAAVAGRVSGETTLTPVGAMGKVTQAAFAVLQPGSVTANLMAANVTGGAAAQCAELLHDLKTGVLIGASPRRQAIAQTVGVLGGAIAGSAAYLVLVPDPARQLLTDEWPAPAVATWRAVAELFAQGISSMPTGALEAMAIGGVMGIVLAVLERALPKKYASFVPSPASLGLSFTIQAWTSFSLFFGSMLGWALRRWAPEWSERYLTVVASGVIAGESLAGVAIAIHAILGG